MIKGLEALTETATLELDGPDGAPAMVALDSNDIDEKTGKPRQHRLTIELVRADSSEAQKKQRQQQNARLKKASKTRRLNLRQEELDAEALDIAVFCTRGWANFMNADDTPMPCSAVNVRKLYEDNRYTWLYRQVSEFIEQPANFAGNSSTS